jgi:hypothetical protein
MKRYFRFLGMVSIGLLVLWIWIRHGQFYSPVLSREFYSLVDKSHREKLDLRQLKSVEWDELVFWGPYEDICDFGIDGFQRGRFSCKSSSDDGECYLLFLKSNRLVGTVGINRRRIDLTAAHLKNRVPREKAIFLFKGESDLPAVELQP